MSSAPLDPSHKGPAAVYLKKVDSAIASNNAAGDGWFKIGESVYDETSDTWGTTKMIENNGHISVQIPEDIEGGYYLARTELLALHAASSNPPNPQFFVGCAQLFIQSNGTAKPSTVRIDEGTYNLSMPGLTYNIWEKPLSLPYPMVGPTVYRAGSGASSSATAPSAASVTAVSSTAPATVTQVVTPLPTTSASSSQQNVGSCGVVIAEEIEKRDTLVQTEGLKPEGCIFVNGNWCGFEVPSYTDQDSCWAVSLFLLPYSIKKRKRNVTKLTPAYKQSSNNCWAQSDDCWNKTQPTGYNLCPIWQAKCREISNGCENGTWTGPSHQGEDMTPSWPSLRGELKIFN